MTEHDQGSFEQQAQDAARNVIFAAHRGIVEMLGRLETDAMWLLTTVGGPRDEKSTQSLHHRGDHIRAVGESIYSAVAACDMVREALELLDPEAESDGVQNAVGQTADPMAPTADPEPAAPVPDQAAAQQPESKKSAMTEEVVRRAGAVKEAMRARSRHAVIAVGLSLLDRDGLERVAEIAQACGVSEVTVRRWAHTDAELRAQGSGDASEGGEGGEEDDRGEDATDSAAVSAADEDFIAAPEFAVDVEEQERYGEQLDLYQALSEERAEGRLVGVDHG